MLCACPESVQDWPEDQSTDAAGKKIEAYFTDTDGTDKVAMSCGPGAWRRSNGWLHGARKAVVRAQSFVIPYNPGITATEALALPFFTPKRAEAQ